MLGHWRHVAQFWAVRSGGVDWGWLGPRVRVEVRGRLSASEWPGGSEWLWVA